MRPSKELSAHHKAMICRSTYFNTTKDGGDRKGVVERDLPSNLEKS